jgi:CheY-like chemotaxis protein
MLHLSVGSDWFHAAMPTVLIVENDGALRHMIERYLTRFGITVVAVPDTTVALRILDKVGHGIDTLLTEIIMPKGNPHGVALAGMAKQADGNLRIIYMTGRWDVLLAIGNRPAGPVFLKPFHLDLLTAGILGRRPQKLRPSGGHFTTPTWIRPPCSDARAAQCQTRRRRSVPLSGFHAHPTDDRGWPTRPSARPSGGPAYSFPWRGPDPNRP